MKFTRVKINNYYNLKDVDLDLTNGNTLIVGPNGSGKTNIIKCIHFLLHRIIDILRVKDQRQTFAAENRFLKRRHFFVARDLTALNIWNQDERYCCIEVYAQFNKIELELFSEIRTLLLMADVCSVVLAIVKCLMNRAVECARCFFKQHPKKKKADFITSLLQDEEGLFSCLPQTLFKKVIDYSPHSKLHVRYEEYCRDYDMDPEEHNGYHATYDNLCVSSLIDEVMKELFPKLLRITRSAFSECTSGAVIPPKEGADVKMWTQRGCGWSLETLDDLVFSIDVLDDVWLPANLHTDRECKVIFQVLNDLFGELKGVHFYSHIFGYGHAKLAGSLEEAVYGLPRTVFSNINVCASLEEAKLQLMVDDDLSSDFVGGSLNALINRRFTDWRILFSSCLKKLNLTEMAVKSKEDLIRAAAIKCLARSTVNCTLPQSRGGAMESNEFSITLNSLEQVLVSSKLSDDEFVQQQFGKVADGMNFFCGVKLDVVQKTKVKEGNIRKMAEQVANAVQRKDDVDLFELGHRLSSIGNEMMQKANSRSDQLHIMVTRTLGNEDSSYSHRTPLFGLSGGEIELLMVLCAIHLSGADTVLLDEPGHSLHPPQQAQLRRLIETLQPPDPACLVVTHSAEFISRNSLRSVYHMSFTGKGFTPCRIIGDLAGGEQQLVKSGEPAVSTAVATSGRAQSTSPVILSKEMISMLMRPDMRKMFFASGVYFVEGETDKLILSTLRHVLLKDAHNTKEMIQAGNREELLRALEIIEMDHWDIMPLGGCREAMKAYRASAQLKIPCAIVLDLDTIAVKHGVEPFSSKTWKSSPLYKELTNERQLNFLPVAPILDRIESVFKKDAVTEEALSEVRAILQEHGIWIWKGDLESVICDDPEVRRQLRNTECFMEALGENVSGSCPVRCREKITVEDATDSFNKRVSLPLVSFMDDLQKELDAACGRFRENPSQAVTEHLQKLIIGCRRYKQALLQHDDMMTNQRPKKCVTDPSLDSQSDQDVASKVPEAAQSSADEGSNNAGLSEDIFWDRTKRKLHKGGWMRLPWETLVKVVEVSIQTKPSPLKGFCEFMREWQCKGKKKVKVADLSRSLLSKLFDSPKSDNVD